MKLFELVYVIEDDFITSKITELYLQQHGAFKRVQKYKNGQPALDALHRASDQPAKLPDLILLDLNMPVMDGWEFLDALSAEHWPKPVPVCVLTSSINPDDIKRATSYTAVQGYFIKPMDAHLVDEMVQLLE
ncbi:response regulator [Hymenobacter sp. 5516J-16]|uniref:Response regulator n=1 Tax=Hymenobacter sublimis TaxID=2933777 RepID=A0ABY4J704_9BACT|nr:MULTISPECIES: response regulator [Hymenobacter]UOQ77777.1 response regulator [Hymenobacter sp. 5516J-16]UPL47763.1 response regulator [Hymenobacter sublimis]